jgi:4-diphosphocytidyl-2-C-methyl-D-erythritol kinase
MPRVLVLRPPAKINLMLRVGAPRPDGFHDVHTLLQSIAIADTLRFTARRGPFVLETRGPGVPADRQNLVWQAAATFWRTLGRSGEPRDVHVNLQKAIPIAAGLGGASADAAATLQALNVLWDAKRPRPELARVAATLGADVPFFLQGGTALGLGRGDEIYPVDDLPRFGILVVKPSFGVSTADAYRWLDEDRAANPPPPEGPAAGSIDVGWPAGAVRLENDLQAPVARRHPEIGTIVAACLAEGAKGAAMTGSGSAVFAVFSEAAAQRAARRLHRPEWLVLVTRTLTRREAGRRSGL